METQVIDIFEELSWRGLIYQTTDESIQNWLNEKPRTIYIGFDPTADSLHVGSLMQLMTLRRFQRAGHKPIALVGGATGMIGDPSGRSDERNLLSAEDLARNLAGIEKQMRDILDFDCGENSAVLVNNIDWMKEFSYIEFLRDIGKNFPVNVMMAKDSVKSRLEGESGLSYTEFSYMLLQAYDFVHLNQAFQCELQVGGSDQWGNITAGIDLARRMHSVKLQAITCPLLTTSAGEKMGKTAAGAVWLSAEKTSPYAFYQYFRNLRDDDAGKCLRFLSEFDEDTVKELDESRATEPHINRTQKELAAQLTEIVHGQTGLKKALKATEVFFGAEIDDISASELSEVFADVPSESISLSEVGNITLIEAFAAIGLAKSKGEARRTIEQGGGYINNRRVEDQDGVKAIERVISKEDLIDGQMAVLRSGKKKFGLLLVE